MHVPLAKHLAASQIMSLHYLVKYCCLLDAHIYKPFWWSLCCNFEYRSVLTTATLLLLPFFCFTNRFFGVTLVLAGSPKLKFRESSEHIYTRRTLSCRPTNSLNTLAESDRFMVMIVLPLVNDNVYVQVRACVCVCVRALQRLLNANPRPECFVSANLPVNKQKNRLVNVLPCQFIVASLLATTGRVYTYIYIYLFNMKSYTKYT